METTAVPATLADRLATSDVTAPTRLEVDTEDPEADLATTAASPATSAEVSLHSRMVTRLFSPLLRDIVPDALS